ncbi:MAG: hypothetical protein V7731_20620 [Amphritea sp.]
MLIDKLSVAKAGKERDANTSWEEIAASLDSYARRLRSRLDAEQMKCSKDGDPGNEVSAYKFANGQQ